MLLIETNLSADEAVLADLLTALPPSWCARAKRYKPFDARLRSAIGYTLLARILRERYETDELPALKTDAHGKPYFPDCPLYFNISHCKTAVACVVDVVPVAVDVQDTLTDISPALAARIAAPDDAADSDALALTALWTRKEASAKLDGRGLSIGLAHLPLNTHDIQTTQTDRYCLSIAKERVL